MNNATIISVIELKLPEKILNECIKEVFVKNRAHRTRFLSLMQMTIILEPDSVPDSKLGLI